MPLDGWIYDILLLQLSHEVSKIDNQYVFNGRITTSGWVNIEIPASVLNGPVTYLTWFWATMGFRPPFDFYPLSKCTKPPVVAPYSSLIPTKYSA